MLHRLMIRFKMHIAQMNEMNLETFSKRVVWQDQYTVPENNSKVVFYEIASEASFALSEFFASKWEIFHHF